MTNKQFDLLELPYDIQWIIYSLISVIEFRNLFLASQKFTVLAHDLTNTYNEWVVTEHGKKTVDVDFHCKALTSPRMRDFTE